MNRVPENIKLPGWRPTLLCIFVVALLIRGVFILTLQDGFYFSDSVHYSKAADNLITNGEFGETYKRPPVYPVFLAGVYVIFGRDIVSIRIVQALMGAFLAIVIAMMARRIGGQGVGALAGILWSIYPMGVFIAGLVYPTTVATILLACAMLCMVTKANQELGRVRVLFGGLLFGLAALTKPVTLVTVSFTTLWILYWRSTHRLLLATLFLLGVGLTLAPWTVRNFYVHEGIVIVEARAVRNLPRLGKTEMDGGNRERGKIKAILANPDEFVIHFVKTFGQFWALYPQRVKMSDPAVREKKHAKYSRVVRKTAIGTNWTSIISILSVGPMFFFALIGVGTILVHKERRYDLSLLCLVILSFAIGYAFFHTSLRYRIPVEPYILILSAYGLNQMWAIRARWAHKGPEHSPQEPETSRVSPF